MDNTLGALSFQRSPQRLDPLNTGGGQRRGRGAVGR